MFSYKRWLITFVIIFAFFIRVYDLSNVPPGLNRDEAANGYTAYSLLKTGKDEYGTPWPISLKSFGDWKLPFYAYITIPSVAIFGLNEFAVRFPSVIAGTLTVFFTYLIAKELFKKNNIALVSALIITISPWHIFFSRVAAEANVAVLFVASGFYFIIKSEKYSTFLPLGSILLSMTLLTYHGNHIFTPLLFILLVIFYRRIFFTRIGLLSIALFIFLASLIFKETLFTADKTKISGLLSLNDPAIVHSKIELNRSIYKNLIWGKLVNNKYVFFIEQFSYNYLRAFSPEFLFIKGGDNKQHNLPDFGNLYPVEIIFIAGGLYLLFARREKYSLFLLLWILISPIGASLTKDAPHSARQFAIFPALSIVTAYGVCNLSQIIKKRSFVKGFTYSVSFIYLASFFLFISKYFIVFPYKTYSAWGKGYKELIQKLLLIKNNYKEVFIARPDYSPYIYYLFYQKADPRRVQSQIKRYPPTSEGFVHVLEFDGIKYQKLNWTDELLLPDRLYVDWSEGIPKGATNSAIFITKTELESLNKNHADTTSLAIGTLVNSKIVDSVLTPDGQPLFNLIKTYLATSPGKKNEILQ